MTRETSDRLANYKPARSQQSVGDLLLESREGDLVASQLELEMAITGQGDTGGIRPIKAATVKLISVVRSSVSGRRVLVVILYMGEQVSTWVPRTWRVYHD